MGCSITKTFTAALYVEALHEGSMTAQTSIQAYLPKRVALGRCAAAVTLQDLADFRSGMPLLPADAPRRLLQRSIDRYTVADFYAWLAGWSPGGTVPGGSQRAQCGLPAPYAYSNASVGLLGLLTSVAYGTHWDRLVADRITGPLGAVDTAVSVNAEQGSRDWRRDMGHAADP